MTAEGPSAERSSLPVLWEPPAEPVRGGRGEYVPRHALQPRKRRDRTNLWLWLVLALTSSFVVGTTAAFDATVGDSGNAFGSVSLGVPGAQTLTMSGTNLTASVASFGGFDAGGGTVGVRWRYYDPTGVSSDGTAPTCSNLNSAYPSTQDFGSSLTTSRTQPLDGVEQGRWRCFMAFTTYPAAEPVAPAVQWLSQAGNPRGAVQAGHVVQKVALTNKVGGTAGTIENGDTITITFNQEVDPGNGRPSLGGVCLGTTTGSYVLIGHTCNNSTPASVSTLALVPRTGVSSVVATPLNFGSSSWVWTNNKVLTITLAGGNGNTTGNGKNAVSLNSVAVTGCDGSVPCYTGSTAWTAGAGGIANGAADATLRSAGQPYLPLCKTQPAGAPDAGICHPDVTGRF